MTKLALRAIFLTAALAGASLVLTDELIVLSLMVAAGSLLITERLLRRGEHHRP